MEKKSSVTEKAPIDLFKHKTIYRPAERVIQVKESGEITTKINTNSNDNYPAKRSSSIRPAKHYYSPFPQKQKTKRQSDEKSDPSLNKVAKAGFRMSIYSTIFLAGALILFNEFILFYIVLGLFILAFIFAMVAILTSISANKDKFNTNRKGHRFSRFGLIVSLLILAALAAFFIFTPVTF